MVRSLQPYSIGTEPVFYRSPPATRRASGMLDSGKAIAQLKGHADWITRAAFSPDGSRIISGSTDRTARVWDSSSGQTIAELKGHKAAVLSAVFSPDGTRAVTASEDGTARVWDASSGKSIAILEGHTASVWSAVFSPDGTRIVTASTDNTARVWDANSGQSVTELKGHTNSRVVWLSSAPTAPESSRPPFDRTAKVWDASLGQDHRGSEGTRRLSPLRPFQSRRCPSRHGVSGYDGAGLGDELGQDSHRCSWGTPVSSCRPAFSPDGRFVVTGSADFTARIWDPDSGTGLAEVERTPVDRPWGECQPGRHAPAYRLRRWRRADLGDRPAHDRHHAHRAYRRRQVRGLQFRWCPRGDRLGRQDRPDLGCAHPAGRSWCSRGTRPR